MAKSIKVLPTKKIKVAYFSMEIGLSNQVPTFSGGLGVLAGDTLKSAADLAAPMVAVSLLYNKGYFKQGIDEQGNQVESPVTWSPAEFMKKLPNKVEVLVEGRQVKIQAWLYSLKGVSGHILPVFFLDTNLEENALHDREITNQLYGGELYHRIVQELVLGIGGVKMLDALGYTDLQTYHMNEGHAAFLILELLSKHNWQNEEVKKRCTFTTHTPVSAGHDEFPYDLANKVLGKYLPWHIKEIAGHHMLNMTLLALNMSRYANAVAQKHGEVSRNLFPQFSIDAITNGVHSVTWTSSSFQALFNKYVPAWKKNPLSLSKASGIPLDKIWNAHQTEKIKLLDFVKKTTGVEMDPEILTIGFARRAATYKRGDLIFSDIDRLIKICRGKVQIIFAGKAHPKDIPGKDVIKKIYNISKRMSEDNVIKMVFLPNYDMVLGGMLTAGVDVWLNNPIRPREASGTSGMKAVHNGVPNFSVLDGWWIEGCEENVTGWAIGPKATECFLIENDNSEDANDLYKKLEHSLIPTYYKNRKQWMTIMRNAISKNAAFFNTHRMLQEYCLKGYQLQGECAIKNKTA